MIPLVSRLVSRRLVPVFLAALAASVSAQNINVEWNDPRQSIDGFGASSAWMGDDIYDHPNRTQILDLLFTNTGASLSIVRLRIDPKLHPAAGTYDWARLETAREAWVAQQAIQRGVNKVWAAPWTPPAWMKSNNDTDNGGSLLSARYGDYAAFLVAYAAKLKTDYNVNLYGLSVQNEPNLSTPYESCVWTSAQMRDFIKNNLGPALENNSNTANVRIIAPEHEIWNSLGTYVDPILTDPVSDAYLEVIASHNYKNSPTNTYSFTKPVWLTEQSNLGANDASITDGLRWAETFHDFLAKKNLAAVHYWWLVTSKTTGEGLLNITTTGYSVNKRLYTIGNFSRFVRPGDVRIDTRTLSMPANVFVSAYKNDGSKKVVIVAVNRNSSAQSLTIGLDGFTASSFTPHRTSSTQNLAQLSAVSAGSSLAVSLPANSVTTYVGTATVSGGNLLSNPGFESGTTGWFGFGPSTLTTVTSPVATGSQAARTSGRNYTYASVGRNITSLLQTNGQGNYTANGKFRLASGSDGVRLRLKITDGSGTRYLAFNSAVTVGNGAYTSLGGTLNITWTGTLSAAELYFQTNATLVDVYADDMSLVK